MTKHGFWSCYWKGIPWCRFTQHEFDSMATRASTTTTYSCTCHAHAPCRVGWQSPRSVTTFFLRRSLSWENISLRLLREWRGSDTPLSWSCLGFSELTERQECCSRDRSFRTKGRVNEVGLTRHQFSAMDNSPLYSFSGGLFPYG